MILIVKIFFSKPYRLENNFPLHSFSVFLLMSISFEGDFLHLCFSTFLKLHRCFVLVAAGTDDAEDNGDGHDQAACNGDDDNDDDGHAKSLCNFDCIICKFIKLFFKFFLSFAAVRSSFVAFNQALINDWAFTFRPLVL